MMLTTKAGRPTSLKCNRGLPCETCVKRHKISQCHYAANANRNPSGASKQREIKDRLNSLEKLVSSFMSGDSIIRQAASPRRTEDISLQVDPCTEPIETSVSSPKSDTTGDDLLTPETPHLQQTGDGQVNYIDANHWQSILEDIHEIREHLSSSNQSMEQSAPLERTLADASFLFGSVPNATYAEILTSLPAQPICDKLLSWYFGTSLLVSGIIHPEKFQMEYEAFWAAPMETSPLWTALLFSLLSIMARRYATANAYALEAFLMHLVSNLACKSTSSTNLWFEMGTIIRLSFRMGYHRDPSTLPRMSVFDGEMRRRLWFNIVHIEALMSSQLGFPSMIPTDFCDTKLPRNLYYSQLQTDMKSLPPGKPLSEKTPIRYSIAKDSVMSVFKKIAAHTQSLAVPVHESFTRTIALHHELHEGYNGLPAVLKRRDINLSFLDSSEIIIERYSIETLFQQGLIILHRRYISCDPRSQRFEFSRNACIEAALDMLARQVDMHKACGPGGRLYEERWLVYKLPAYGVLLAAMVVCLDLSVCMRRSRETTPAAEVVDKHDLLGREYRALQTSREIWAAMGDSTAEAPIALNALDLMIRKVAEHNVAPPLALNVASPSHEDLTANPAPPFQYAGAMSQMIDGSEDLDWTLLDQYLQNLDGLETDAFV
ncbi:hypothetical protein NPX13_g4927 [Xylaria arbuscula]|uniref:Xylanolytic transcriptional activator regulatory domain-containing protein n=1 Tax=Xylaria arbuscula TaxID=114810 RepID=A0A9W8NFI2_9PEZI|nr:hypothetical protein NPX13_g4927 [Xylaria arbuscula]